MTGEEYYDYRPICEKTLKNYLNQADPSGKLAELFNDLCKWRSQRDDMNAKRHTTKTVTKEGKKTGTDRWDEEEKEMDSQVEGKDDDSVGRVLANENLKEAAEAFCHGYEEAISKTASTTLIPIQVSFPSLTKDMTWSPTTYDPKHIKTVYQKYLSDEDWEVNRKRGLKVGQGVKKALKKTIIEEFEGNFRQWLAIVRVDNIALGFSD